MDKYRVVFHRMFNRELGMLEDKHPKAVIIMSSDYEVAIQEAKYRVSDDFRFNSHVSVTKISR